jgi:hypothetical protein
MHAGRVLPARRNGEALMLMRPPVWASPMRSPELPRPE